VPEESRGVLEKPGQTWKNLAVRDAWAKQKVFNHSRDDDFEDGMADEIVEAAAPFS
jgi:hypothetical protein